MPADGWIETTIGAQVTLQRGFDITKVEQRKGTVPVISSGGVSSYHDTAAVSGPGVILGRKGVVGSVYYVREDYWPHDTTLWVKDFKSSDPRFVYYFFRYQAAALASLDVGSANPTLNRNHVHPIRVQWPSLADQQAIAHILGTLDDKIELNQRTNATLEAMAQALFKNWFIDFDPVRAKANGRWPIGMDAGAAALFSATFEDSPQGKIPTGWKIQPLYELAQWINGGAFRQEHFSNEKSGLPIIKIGELKDGITSETKFTELDFPSKIRIDSGEILFSWSGSPDTSIGTFVWCGGQGWLNQHIFRVVTSSAERRVFLFYLLRELHAVFVEIARDKQTTGLGHVTVADMKRLQVVLPDDAVAAVFCELAGPIFGRVYHNLCESRQLASIRDALLPKLLSGKLAVNTASRERG